MKPGIYTIPAIDYHDDPCDEPSLSSGIAGLLANRTPWHAWTAHPRLNPDYRRDHEDRFDLGTAAHELLLEPRDPAEVMVIVDADSWRSKDAKAARENAREEGKTALLAKQVEEVVAMLTACRVQLKQLDVDPPVLTDGKPEQTMIWQESGVTCRAMCDWLRDDRRGICDYKTTSASADPGKWVRTMLGIGGDVQAAFYLRGLEHLTGGLTGPAEFRFVVQETYPPYALSVVGLEPAMLELANAKIDYAIAAWRKCLDSGQWPGYPTRMAYPELPAYDEAAWLKKEAREEVAP